MCYAPAEKLSRFCRSPEAEIKRCIIVTLAEESSRQCKIQTLACILLGAFSLLYIENQEQEVQLRVFKCGAFHQKGSSCKFGVCNVGAQETLDAGKISIKIW